MPTDADPGSPFPRVSPAEAERLLREQGHVYLDVRSVPEFDQGHPAGAYNVPLQHPGPEGMVDNPDFLRVVRAALPREQPIVVGCRSGNRSQRAATLLLEAGYARVVDQRAGFEGVKDPFGRGGEKGWRALGLPAATGAEPGRDYEALRRGAKG